MRIPDYVLARCGTRPEITAYNTVLCTKPLMRPLRHITLGVRQYTCTLYVTNYGKNHLPVTTSMTNIHISKENDLFAKRRFHAVYTDNVQSKLHLTGSKNKLSIRMVIPNILANLNGTASRRLRISKIDN